jgi:NADH-quinone oxidoreductase subunit G
VRARLAAVNPVFAHIDEVTPAAWGPFGTAGALSDAPLVSPVSNFYQTDPISRASPTMAQCVALHMGPERTGTNG